MGSNPIRCSNLTAVFNSPLCAFIFGVPDPSLHPAPVPQRMPSGSPRCCPPGLAFSVSASGSHRDRGHARDSLFRRACLTLRTSPLLCRAQTDFTRLDVYWSGSPPGCFGWAGFWHSLYIVRRPVSLCPDALFYVSSRAEKLNSAPEVHVDVCRRRRRNSPF
jgi:hypothetical protein